MYHDQIRLDFLLVLSPFFIFLFDVLYGFCMHPSRQPRRSPELYHGSLDL